MGILIVIVGAVLALAGIVCNLYLVYEAFQEEAWKGIVGFFFPLYLYYFALVEWEHDQKWPIVLGAIFGSGLGGVLIGAGTSMMR
jgi:hypothetical protein